MITEQDYADALVRFPDFDPLKHDWIIRRGKIIGFGAKPEEIPDDPAP
tara:strand:+ start:408 stop:551 length:144 start_codon:yes stop_codon:yes gene_type:complete